VRRPGCGRPIPTACRLTSQRWPLRFWRTVDWSRPWAGPRSIAGFFRAAKLAGACTRLANSHRRLVLCSGRAPTCCVGGALIPNLQEWLDEPLHPWAPDERPLIINALVSEIMSNHGADRTRPRRHPRGHRQGRGRRARADWDAITDMFTEDAIRFPPNQQPIRGRVAMRAWLETFPPFEEFAITAMKSSAARGSRSCAEPTR